jgi:hypothetical protein
MLWLAAAGAYIAVSYQTVPQHDLIKGRMTFDDLIPAYEDCWPWETSDGKKVDRSSYSDAMLSEVAECERSVDRRQILETGIPVALGIPLIVLIIGWGLVWAFRGFLPARSP